MAKFKKHNKFDGIFLSGYKETQRIYTINLDFNKSIYGEKLLLDGDLQYREWNPFRSKLCASIKCNARKIFLNPSSKVLYLGASSGTTVSHISDIVTKGIIYAVEFSSRSLRELVQNSVDRQNIIPILGDANHPHEYLKFITGAIDLIYMDVAQPNQSEILIKNAKMYLKPGVGKFIFAVKSRSIDSVANPKEIFKKEIETLEDAGLNVTDNVNITSFQTDHVVLFGRYQGSNETN